MIFVSLLNTSSRKPIEIIKKLKNSFQIIKKNYKISKWARQPAVKRIDSCCHPERVRQKFIEPKKSNKYIE